MFQQYLAVGQNVPLRKPKLSRRHKVQGCQLGLTYTVSIVSFLHCCAGAAADDPRALDVPPAAVAVDAATLPAAAPVGVASPVSEEATQVGDQVVAPTGEVGATQTTAAAGRLQTAVPLTPVAVKEPGKSNWFLFFTAITSLCANTLGVYLFLLTVRGDSKS